MRDPRLNACPFCGSKIVHLADTTQDGTNFIFAVCDNCRSSSGHFCRHEEGALVAAWNRRLARADQPDALVAALERILAECDGPSEHLVADGEGVRGGCGTCDTYWDEDTSEHHMPGCHWKIASDALAAHRDGGRREAGEAVRIQEGDPLYVPPGPRRNTAGVECSRAATPQPAPGGTAHETKIHASRDGDVFWATCYCGWSSEPHQNEGLIKIAARGHRDIAAVAPEPPESADLGALLERLTTTRRDLRDAMCRECGHSTMERWDAADDAFVDFAGGIVDALRSAQGAGEPGGVSDGDSA
jgi:hypothetical protein